MKTLSRMASNCRKCPYSDTCQNKRMEMVAFAELPELITAETSQSASMKPTILVAGNTDTVSINLGGGDSLMVDRDELRREMHKAMGKGLRIGILE